jgi:hypothetical protein
MRFRNWFETEENNPWSQEHPWLSRLSNFEYNKAEVYVFVEQMANKGANATAIYNSLRNQSVRQERYNKPIANNLLIYNDARLKNAIGEIHNSDTSNFAFYAKGEKAGTILIAHPPVIYDDIDKHLLFGVIVHELSHADHWLKDKRFKPAKRPKWEGDIEKYRFDTDKYARHWTECWGHSQHLISILYRIPDKKTILDALNRPTTMDTYPWQGAKPYVKESPFSLSPVLLEFAKEFLSHYQGRNEGVLANIAAPFVTAAATMLNPATAEAPPQGVMQQQVISQAHEAANLLRQIIQKMLFRNFLMQA